MAFWDTRANEWTEEWRPTNQLPGLMLIKLGLRQTDSHSRQTIQETTRVVALPSQGVPPQLQSAAGPAFDLEPAARAAARLETFATEVDRLPRPSAEPARLSLDRVLVRVTKRLNSTLYKRAGRFEQDPAATLPLLPRLARAAELAAQPRDGDAFGFLEVELLRGRNQVVATLTEAADEIEHYLEAVRGETR